MYGGGAYGTLPYAAWPSGSVPQVDARCTYSVTTTSTATFAGSFTEEVNIDVRANFDELVGASCAFASGLGLTTKVSRLCGAVAAFRSMADREGRFTLLSSASASFAGSRPYAFAAQAGVASSIKGGIGWGGVAHGVAGASGAISSSTGVCGEFSEVRGATVSMLGADGRAGASEFPAYSTVSFLARSDFDEIPPFDPSTPCVLSTSRTQRIEVLS